MSLSCFVTHIIIANFVKYHLSGFLIKSVKMLHLPKHYLELIQRPSTEKEQLVLIGINPNNLYTSYLLKEYTILT